MHRTDFSLFVGLNCYDLFVILQNPSSSSFLLVLIVSFLDVSD